MKILKNFLATLLLGSLIAAQQSTAADDPLRVKVATLAPRGSLYHRVLQEVGESWRRAEAPGAEFIVYPDGSQGGESDVVRRMRIGQLQAALISVVGLSEIDPSVGGLQKMPMVFQSWEEVDYVSRGMHPRIEKVFADKGYKVLFWTEAGWVRFFTQEPATHPDDLKPRRIFAWAGDNQHAEMVRTLGYHPVVLETEDIIPGLQSGLIDTVAVTAMWALATQIDRLAPYMVDMKWAPIIGALVIKTETWNAMSPAGQVAITQASLQAAETLSDYQKRADDEAVQAMVERGLNVQVLSPEDKAAWSRLADAALPMIRGTTVPAEDFDEVMRLLAEHRREHGVQ